MHLSVHPGNYTVTLTRSVYQINNVAIAATDNAASTVMFNTMPQLLSGVQATSAGYASIAMGPNCANRFAYTTASLTNGFMISAWIRIDSGLAAVDTNTVNVRELIVIGKVGNGLAHASCNGAASFCQGGTVALRLDYGASQFLYRSCTVSADGNPITPQPGIWYAITYGVDSTGQAQMFINGIYNGGFYMGAFTPSG